MNHNTRRKFLQVVGSGAVVAALPDSISKALAIPADDRTGTIEDVQHIVILTQENQSFDHYFGSLSGVRGFNDPRVAKLPNGDPVWLQPDGQGGKLPPFRVNLPSLGLTYLPGTAHDWNSSHGAWNDGRYDRWVPNKSPMTMSYLNRNDIPYHYALADAFTLCDAYYCSVMGPTDPNRYHMWTGWLGNDGKNGGPVLSNAEAGYDWKTFPERLQVAGITWKVYQDVGTGLTADGYWGWTDDPYIGNYGDNSLLYFHQYQSAQPGDPLADLAKSGTNVSSSGTLFDQLRHDVSTGRLPQVSWIAAPEAYSEHPNWPSNFGAWYISQVLDILVSNPEVWSKTVFLLNWDENDGLFDHLIAPTPPSSAAGGLSTVDTIDEVYVDDGKSGFVSGPIGLGTRVALLALSPWSRGGRVNSQIFDHTSLIRFIERRFARQHPGLVETNITPWRRAVCGDLTSIFNFERPNAGRVSLPSTAAYAPPDRLRHDDYPVDASNVTVGLPKQERGVRPACALPYELDVRASCDPSAGTVSLRFVNTGRATAVFQVRSGDARDLPRSYTVEPGKTLADSWKVAADYRLEVHAPNGFFRSYKGTLDSGDRGARLETHAVYSADGRGRVGLVIRNASRHATSVVVVDAYSGATTKRLLAPREDWDPSWSLGAFDGWYDFVIRADGDATFEHRLAGHVETGRESTTDPAIGGHVLKA